MAIAIRPFTLDDVAYLADQQQLLNQHHQPYDQDYYAPSAGARQEFATYIARRVHDSDFVILIAEQAGQRLGYTMGWIETRPPIYRHRKVGYLSHIFVSPEHRRQGIARLLFAAIDAWFRERSVDFIEIHSDARNAETLRTFRQVGFQELSVSFYKTNLKTRP